MTPPPVSEVPQDAAARPLTAVVVKYDPDHSLLHPLNASFLNDIGLAYVAASQRSGWTETWMAVYNECVRVGALALIDPVDHRANAARETAARAAALPAQSLPTLKE